jgi:hypothetical protein
VLHITKENQEIRRRIFYARADPFEPFSAPARKMPSMPGEIRLDSKMKVSNNKNPCTVFHKKRRSVTVELELHSSLMIPFWGW